MAKSSVAGLLTSVDEIFTTQEEREEAKLSKIVNMPLSLIDDFPGHPYHVRMDEDMDLLVDSVKKRGILVPVLVMPKDDGRYLMVTGHRRKKACELAGLETIRAEVRELTMDEAIVEMVDSNLQRSSILPSEKAFAYKMKLDAMNRQGQRTDLTSAPVGQKLAASSRDTLANKSPDSSSQIQRYIRLTYLTPDLLEMVDNAAVKAPGTPQIALRPAVELSYLTEQEQIDLVETISYEDATPSLSQAQKMRDFSEKGKLNADVILSIMCEQKGNQKEKFTFQAERLRPYIPAHLSKDKAEDYVLKALEYYKRHLDRMRQQAR